VTFKAWRRIPEAGACAFCLMLATRGAVYSSARTAGEGNAYHRHCRCDAALETDFDKRKDVYIDPADANQTITVRNRTGRTYQYDLRQYGVKNPPDLPRIPKVDEAIREWHVPTDDDALTFLAQTADKESVAWKRAQLFVEQYEVRSNGIDIIAVPKSKSGKVSAQYLRRLKVMQEVMDDVLPRLPRWRRYDADGNVRPYMVFVDSKHFRGKTARGFTYRGSDTVFMNPKTVDLGIDPGTPGWSMPSAAKVARARYTLAHEFGHTVDLPGNNAASARLYKTWRDSPDLSTYGKSKEVEAYAEAFAEWCYGDRTNPVVAAYAKEFGWDADSAVGYWATQKALRVWTLS